MATARSLIAGLTLALTAISCTDKGPTEANTTSDNQTPKAEFQNNSQQTGLVNVSVGDVDVLNNVNVAVAANVIATVCGVNIPVALLAQQVFVDGSETVCTGTTDPVTITQATPGANAAPTGGNNSRQEGLVNVSLGNVAILNNVNVAVAANVLVTVCHLDVAAAILAVQAVGDVSQTFCETSAGAIHIVQS
jgi:hypothetical protein